MKTLLSVLILVALAPAQTLPEAPQRILDWQFVSAHAVYGASNAFDNYVTQRGLGCAFEGNPDLGRNPSARAQAIHGLVEFSAVVAGDAAFKWFGRRQGIPRWLNSLGGNLGAFIGTGKHLQGGLAWVHTGCL